MSIGYPAIDNTDPTAVADCHGMRCTQRGHAHYVQTSAGDFAHNLAGWFC